MFKMFYHELFAKLIVIFLVIYTVRANNQPEWQLVDDFDFNYNSVDDFYQDSRWIIDDEPENLCSGGNIYQYSCHRKKNVNINGEKQLVISAELNQNQGNSRFMFNSGQISSNKSWTYGKFVMRAKLPEGKLLRSVFVLKPKQPKYSGDWLDNGQINGLVYAQQSNSIIGGIHFRMPQGQSYNGRKLHTQHNITNEFNLYSIEWTDKSIQWLFNGIIYFKQPVSKPFDQPFYFVLQLGVGGPEFDTRNTVVQSYDASTWNNNQFVIDYIKVFQQESSPNSDASVFISSVLWVFVVAVSILFHF